MMNNMIHDNIQILGEMCSYDDLMDAEKFAIAWATNRIEELEAKMKWQPIETAPKDGTDILTFGRFGGYYSGVRYWGEGEDGYMAWQPRIRGCFPTHWMPLPEPPLLGKENEDG